MEIWQIILALISIIGLTYLIFKVTKFVLKIIIVMMIIIIIYYLIK